MNCSLAAHADWSIDPRKRWVTIAQRTTTGLDPERASAGRRRSHVPVAPARRGRRRRGRHWAPTCPSAFRAPTPPPGPNRISQPSSATLPAMPDFFSVCSTLDDIRPDRPFYPARGIAGMTRLSHALALGLPDAVCAVPTVRPSNNGASGRGAVVLDPGRQPVRQGRHRRLAAFDPARHWPTRTRCDLWPFEGPFRSLLAPGSVALAETYPAEALRHLGIRLRGSKRRHADRCATAGALVTAMDQQSATPDDAMRQAVRDGFGADAAGEDRFDSVLGVLCVLNVLAGAPSRHRAGRSVDPALGRLGAWPNGAAAAPAAGLAMASAPPAAGS